MYLCRSIIIAADQFLWITKSVLKTAAMDCQNSDFKQAD